MIVASIFRMVLSLRYRVKIHGAQLSDHDGPVLILPNHPGLIDPVILTAYLSHRHAITPVVTSGFYDKRLLRPLFQRLGAVRVPDFEGGSRDVGGIQQMYQSLIQALGSGKHILLYPSGQTYRQGYEVIMGKQTVYTLLQNLPVGTKVLMVRTRGIWGSIFSKAYFGTPVPFGRMIMSAIRFLIANAVFRLPRRTVSIFVQDQTQRLQDQAKNLTLTEFNAQLQDRYNTPGREDPTFVRHYRWYHDTKDRFVAPYIQGSVEYLQPTYRDYSTTDPLIYDTIVKIVSDIKHPHIPLTTHTALLFDLHMDSLDLAETKITILQHYPQASNTPLLLLKTIGDLALMAMGHELVHEHMPACSRPRSRSTHQHDVRYLVDRSADSAGSILHYRSHTVSSGSAASYIYDLKSGLQSTGDIALKAHVLSQLLTPYKETNIGIMMPAVAATHVLILAVYYAHKIPVMINRTVSLQSIQHCIQASGISHIVTSRSFVAKLTVSWLSEYDHMFIYLEDLVEHMTTRHKMAGLLSSWRAYRGRLPIRQQASDTAVILFTSGSESVPKLVSLTHANVVSNIQGVLSLFELYDSDVLLHCLPPFHSFGYSINTVLSLLTGLRVVCSPDPTNSSTLIRLIHHTQATILTMTPTLFHAILTMARPHDLQTLRVVVLGAEACPPALVDRCARDYPHIRIVEGYGITECSPVISLNPVASIKPGTVGLPLLGGSLYIQDLDTGSQAQPGEQGMIYRSSPSVFSGYQDDQISSPFENINGVRYYKTGDLGFVDADGYLTITGRLKRFVKTAGEMISLPEIERYCHDYLQSLSSITDPSINEQSIHEQTGPLIAVEGIEQEGRAKIVVFTTISDLSLEQLQHYLRSRGVSPLAQIRSLHHLPELPMLGSGKIDYKVLKNLIPTLLARS